MNCEPDEFADLVMEMKRAGFVGTHRKPAGALGPINCCGKKVKVRERLIDNESPRLSCLYK